MIQFRRLAMTLRKIGELIARAMAITAQTDEPFIIVVKLELFSGRGEFCQSVIGMAIKTGASGIGVKCYRGFIRIGTDYLMAGTAADIHAFYTETFIIELGGQFMAGAAGNFTVIGAVLTDRPSRIKLKQYHAGRKQQKSPDFA